MFFPTAILYPKPWDIHPKAWDIRPKAWDIRPKAWDILFIWSKISFIAVIDNFLSRVKKVLSQYKEKMGREFAPKLPIVLVLKSLTILQQKKQIFYVNYSVDFDNEM